MKFLNVKHNCFVLKLTFPMPYFLDVWDVPGQCFREVKNMCETLDLGFLLEWLQPPRKSTTICMTSHCVEAVVSCRGCWLTRTDSTITVVCSHATLSIVTRSQSAQLGHQIGRHMLLEIFLQAGSARVEMNKLLIYTVTQSCSPPVGFVYSAKRSLYG